jgi:hypothetical protein
MLGFFQEQVSFSSARGRIFLEILKYWYCMPPLNAEDEKYHQVHS